MKRNVGLWQLAGFSVTAFLGTLLHFLYDWAGEAVWAAPFSGVNESTWEHMKLLFWPMLLFGAVQGRFFRDREDFWCIKLRGISLGLALIPIAFYTYNGVIGKSPDWINIAIFFLAAAVAYFCEAKGLYKDPAPCRPKLALALLLLIAALFVIFTFATPRLGIFLDPLTGTYGI